MPNRYTAILVAALIGSLPGTSALAVSHGVETPGTVSIDAIPVCFDFGCKTREIVNLSLIHWVKIGDLFLPRAENPKQEREQIKQAIAQMETLIGQYTPTHNDLALGLPKNGNRSALPGQLDCIDEAVNTTTYIQLFEQSGFLIHHKVVEQAYRRSMIIQHWAGQLEELTSGRRWTVDSWFHPNGEAPIIQQTKDWKDLSVFTYLKNRLKNRASKQ